VSEALFGLVEGLSALFTHPMYLVAIVVGMFVGLIIGTLPGLNIVAGAALVIPFTYSMDPAFALIFVTSMYVGGIFGGSAPSILFNMPGDTAAACTAIDGYPLTQKGLATRALGVMISASATGGLIGVIAVIFISPMLAKVALSFGPIEYFALCFLGISVVGGVGVDSVTKGIVSGLFGMLLATVGISEFTGMQRFTFGSDSLISGFNYIPIMIGAFAVSEIFLLFRTIATTELKETKLLGKIITLKDFMSMKWVTLRSSLLGTFIGILPGAGATVASFFSYSVEKRMSKNKGEFGKGAIEGVCAPEAANNSAAMGSLVPLLALGIPGGAVAAVMFGIFQIHGLQPGPLLFLNNKDILYPLLASCLIANFLILVIGTAQAKQVSKILKIPKPLLYSIIMALTIIGAYSVNNQLFDIWVMMAFGVIGYLMKEHGYSVAALVLGLILGPILESSFMRGMILTDNNLFAFFKSPIAAPMLVFGILVIAYPLIEILYKRFKGQQSKTDQGHSA
jgi:putative tricarboxylic transport membrane protein